MASIQEHSTKTLKFHLSFPQLIKVEATLECLCNAELNPCGLGLLSITSEGFYISIKNQDLKIFGRLSIGAGQLHGFVCNAPITGKMIMIDQFQQLLFDGTLNKGVSIFMENNNSTSLCIEFGSTGRVARLDLFEPTSMVHFPSFKVLTCVMVSRSFMKRMLNKAREQAKVSPEVLVGLTIADTATFIIGEESDSLGHLHSCDVRLSQQQISPLKQALQTADYIFLSSLAQPEKTVLFSFRLEHLGDMIFTVRCNS